MSIGNDADYELVPTAKEHLFEINGGSFVVTLVLDDNKKVKKGLVKTGDGQEFEAVKLN